MRNITSIPLLDEDTELFHYKNALPLYDPLKTVIARDVVRMTGSDDR